MHRQLTVTAIILGAVLMSVPRTAPQAEPSITESQSVAIDLRVDYDSVAALHAFSLGAAYTIDPHGLWFTARPDGKYPTEFATPDEMRAETTWRYDNSPRSFSVTFRGERVTSFTLPGGA